MVVTDTYPRCPECGAVAYPDATVHHRPRCTFEPIDVEDWNQEEHP